jgi:DNA-binding NtrC family response regulator
MQGQAVRRVCIPLGDWGAGTRKSVLLVTADADLRQAAALALEAAGFEVRTATHSGHATLAALTATRIDVLASDLSGDDLSGPALAERLRRHHPALQTIFFGQSGTPERAGILVQPFTREQLLDAVARTADESPTSASAS